MTSWGFEYGTLDCKSRFLFEASIVKYHKHYCTPPPPPPHYFDISCWRDKICLFVIHSEGKRLLHRKGTAGVMAAQDGPFIAGPALSDISAMAPPLCGKSLNSTEFSSQINQTCFV